MSTTTLRPADVTLSLPPGDFIHGAGGGSRVLRDNDDATYVQFGYITGSIAVVPFDTVTIPDGWRVRSVTMRLRLSGDSGESPPIQPRLDAQLSSGASSGLSNYPVGSSSPYDVAGNPAIQLDGTLPITQAALDALTLRFRSRTAMSLAQIRMYAAYVDVIIAEPPTVAITGPDDPITDTSTPLIAWDYTIGDDGGQQEAYQATVSNDGTVLWDTGVVYSNLQEVLSGVALEDGSTYTISVRAAQMVAGSLHWSAWDDVVVDVTVTPPSTVGIDALILQEAGAVAVVAYPTAGDMEHMDFQRSVDGGATWENLRNGWRLPPIDSSQRTVWDFEAPLGVPVTYRARQVEVGDDFLLVGPWETTDPVVFDLELAWLKDPLEPWAGPYFAEADFDLESNVLRNAQVTLFGNAIPTLRRPIARGVHQIVGASLPVVTTDRRRAVTGQVTFVVLTDDELDTILALLATGRTLLLQTPLAWGWGSRYVSFGDADETRTSPVAQEVTRTLVVPFDEVVIPAGDALLPPAPPEP